ncbi:hypothetical protein KNP414_07511 [Paenibacillus mucilaginosus KNP414]|uniref:Uncharacterized protein n=1 Tax=Paenibacillus mucilaginosus (strain KNP414) TaxID=1036673 RepID=F8FA32_PAEMK|nr:hypothetical protein KNP414_07511 [Paenibacillus mucilaginosus KNP414]
MQLVVRRAFYCQDIVLNADLHIFVKLTGQGTFRAFNRNYCIVKSHVYSAWDRDRFATNTGHVCTSVLSKSVLPDVADNFSAGFSLTSFLVCHNPFGCRQNCDSETAEYARHFLAFRVNAKPWLTDSFQTSDDTLLVRAVFQEQADDTLLAVFDIFSVTDEAFLLEDLSDFALDLRSRNFNSLMTNNVSVTNACKHICNWIGHNHVL